MSTKSRLRPVLARIAATACSPRPESRERMSTSVPSRSSPTATAFFSPGAAGRATESARMILVCRVVDGVY